MSNLDVPAPIDSNLSPNESLNSNDASSFIARALSGITVIKHSRYCSVRVRLYVDQSLLSLRVNKHVIPFPTIVDLMCGKNTTVLSAVSYKVCHPAVCFSIICHNTTFDFQCSNEQEKEWIINGIQQLRKHYRKNQAKGLLQQHLQLSPFISQGKLTETIHNKSHQSMSDNQESHYVQFVYSGISINESNEIKIQ